MISERKYFYTPEVTIFLLLATNTSLYIDKIDRVTHSMFPGICVPTALIADPVMTVWS